MLAQQMRIMERLTAVIDLHSTGDRSQEAVDKLQARVRAIKIMQNLIHPPNRDPHSD